MQFVIASPRMFLTNRLRQPSDGMAEQDVSKSGVKPKYRTKFRAKLAAGSTYKTKLSALSLWLC